MVRFASAVLTSTCMNVRSPDVRGSVAVMADTLAAATDTRHPRVALRAARWAGGGRAWRGR
ncbi:hypothetical protein GCM10009640_14280 [Agrococcus citreus]|uniref:Uncharacterized protein n=1 Tax=Agrococcus citreus TaxID=84643 RepID=A0ABN1YTM7_9MICO